jgi:hypothetical protein
MNRSRIRGYHLVAEDAVASAGALQADHERILAETRAREGAAPTTVEALMYQLRAYGLAALAGPHCRRRLAELSPTQIADLIKRLIYYRKTYPGRDPGITDELLFRLGEQLE